MDHNDDGILVHLQYIRAAVDGVNGRLDALNGRTRTVENKVAVLEDRSDEAKAEGKKSGAVWGATAGGFLAAVVWVLHALFGSGAPK